MKIKNKVRLFLINQADCALYHYDISDAKDDCDEDDRSFLFRQSTKTLLGMFFDKVKWNWQVKDNLKDFFKLLSY